MCQEMGTFLDSEMPGGKTSNIVSLTFLRWKKMINRCLPFWRSNCGRIKRNRYTSTISP